MKASFSPDTRDLRAVIEDIYELRQGQREVSAAWFATEAMHRIHFAITDHRLAYVGCHYAFRVIARDVFAAKFDPVTRDRDAAEQGEIFPDTLQDRYPRKPARGEERVYVLRSLLTPVDRAYNVSQMRKRSAALQKHADALEAEGLESEAA